VTEKKPRGAPKDNMNARTHGLYIVKRAVKEVGLKAIDGRSAVGRALSQWRSDLVRDLGGEDTISTQQQALVGLAVKSKLLLDSIDAWLLQQPSLVNKRKRTLLPVVRERQQLADGLARYLGQLGLEKRVKVKTLAEILAGDDEGNDVEADEGNDHGGDHGGGGGGDPREPDDSS